MIDENESYDWDSTIGKEADDGGFNVLPDGDYPFEVTSLERGRYEGNPQKGTKACPKATVTLKVDGGAYGDAYVKENIFLNRKNAWKIKSLFVCIGLVAADAEEFVPNWTAIIGCSGMCTLKKTQFEGKDGDMRNTNDVKKFLPPTTVTTTAAAVVVPTPIQAAPVQPSFSFPAPTAGA